MPIFHDTKEKTEVPLVRLGFRIRLGIFFMLFCMFIGIYFFSFVSGSQIGLAIENFSVALMKSTIGNFAGFIYDISPSITLGRAALGFADLCTMSIVAVCLTGVAVALISVIIVSIVYIIVETKKEKDDLRAKVALEHEKEDKWA